MTIRHQLLIRIPVVIMGGWIAIWIGVTSWTEQVSRVGSVVWTVVAVVLAVLVVRTARAALVLRADVLVVRGILRTVQIGREQVVGVVERRFRASFLVSLVLRNGRMSGCR